MEFTEIIDFLFGTMQGAGCLIGGGMILCVIVCFIMERKTRKLYKNHEKTEDDWSIFDDDDDEEGEDKD